MSRNDDRDDREDRGSSKLNGSNKKFDFRPRSAETMRENAAQSADIFDTFLKAKFPVFRAKEGKNRIRIMPREGDVSHYGIRIFVHFSVGADNGSYLCLNKMKGEPCPVCEERKLLQREDASDEEIKKYRFTQRTLIWLIDRALEGEGPKLWAVPHTVDTNLASSCIDEDRGIALMPDEPDEGYDLRFEVSGKGQQTKYDVRGPVRDPSSLSDDARLKARWLGFVSENPLESTLQYYTYDYIKDVLGGKSKKKPKDDDDADQPRRIRGKNPDDDDADLPRARTRPNPDNDDDGAPLRSRLPREDDQTVRRARLSEGEDVTPKTRKSLGEELNDDIPDFDKSGSRPISRATHDPEDEEEAPVSSRLRDMSEKGSRRSAD